MKHACLGEDDPVEQVPQRLHADGLCVEDSQGLVHWRSVVDMYEPEPEAYDHPDYGWDTECVRHVIDLVFGRALPGAHRSEVTCIGCSSSRRL